MEKEIDPSTLDPFGDLSPEETAALRKQKEERLKRAEEIKRKYVDPIRYRDKKKEVTNNCAEEKQPEPEKENNWVRRMLLLHKRAIGRQGRKERSEDTINKFLKTLDMLINQEAEQAAIEKINRKPIFLPNYQ